MNKFGVDNEYFEDFKRKYMRDKKLMEIEIMRRNKKQEIVNKIVNICD